MWQEGVADTAHPITYSISHFPHTQSLWAESILFSQNLELQVARFTMKAKVDREERELLTLQISTSKAVVDYPHSHNSSRHLLPSAIHRHSSC